MDALTALLFAVIDINIDPDIGQFGPFRLSWHGFFTAVGILAGVTLSVNLARKDGIPSEVGQEIALVGVPCAIVGARLFYVGEHWGDFKGSPENILLDITEGGITLYGGLIGGVVGGAIYGIIHRWPIGIGLDAAAPGLLLGQALGRVGDLINGEHHADPSSLPWAVKYTHPNTLGELGVAVHPTAGGYELLGDLLILAAILLVARRYVTVPGWVFASYVGLYGLMRFFLSYTRTDEATLSDVPIPQLVGAITVGAAFLVAGWIYKNPGPITEEWAERVGRLADPSESELADDGGTAGT